MATRYSGPIARTITSTMEGQTIEALLLNRLNAGLSTRKWEAQQQEMGEPAHSKHIQRYATVLLEAEGEYSMPLYTVTGAYVPLVRFTQRMICHEIDLGHLPPLPPAGSWLPMKLSIDGRSLRGHENVAIFVSFDESTESQSPLGSFTWAMANMREPELAGASFWHEIGIDVAVAQLRTSVLQIGQATVQVDPYLCADWKCLSYVVGFAPANSVAGEALVCGWCSIDKQFLRTGWLQGSPFAQAAEDNTRCVREIPSLPISRARYCAMHGVNRLLDNTLHLVQSLGHASELARVMHSVCPGWGDEVALRPIQTRAFFMGSAGTDITALYAEDDQQLRRQHPDTTVEDITFGEATEQLISACATYFEFSRLTNPTKTNYAHLFTARNNFLAIYHALRAELTASMHYMTSHFLSYAVADAGAAATRQEGAEHHHKTDRAYGGKVFCGSLKGRSMLQQLLDQQDLHRLLIQRVHFMPSHAQPKTDTDEGNEY